MRLKRVAWNWGSCIVGVHYVKPQEWTETNVEEALVADGVASFHWPEDDTVRQRTEAI
jgi:hypothetical protein